MKQLEEEDQLNLENLFDPSDDKELNDERLLDDSLDIRLLGEEDTDGRILPEDYADEQHHYFNLSTLGVIFSFIFNLIFNYLLKNESFLSKLKECKGHED